MRLNNAFERLNCIRQLLKYKVLFGKRFEIANTVYVRNNFSVSIDEKGKIQIGSDTFFNNGCSLNAKSSIVIGDDCLFGENVKIYDHNHIYSNKVIPIRDQGFKTKNVIIGRNCWIASNVVILPGTRIGEHCVIGANCIVRGELKDNTLMINSGNVEMKSIME
ncbi:acyltransferase [Streptococcus suis]